MNMMNKCAQFYKDSPSGKKVNFNLPSAIELLETADFVYNFSQKMFLYVFYTMVQNCQKWPIIQIKGAVLI